MWKWSDSRGASFLWMWWDSLLQTWFWAQIVFMTIRKVDLQTNQSINQSINQFSNIWYCECVWMRDWYWYWDWESEWEWKWEWTCVLIISVYICVVFEDLIASVAYFMKKKPSLKFLTAYQQRRYFIFLFTHRSFVHSRTHHTLDCLRERTRWISFLSRSYEKESKRL
jgi:hypothetical protein